MQTLSWNITVVTNMIMGEITILIDYYFKLLIIFTIILVITSYFIDPRGEIKCCCSSYYLILQGSDVYLTAVGRKDLVAPKLEMILTEDTWL